MRYITGVIRPVEKIHPIDATLQETAGVHPVRLHETKVFDDGACVALMEIRGDLAKLDRLLAAHDSVREHSIAGDRDGLVYLQTAPYDLTTYLVSLQQNSEVIVQMPLTYTDDGGLRGTVLGEQSAFREAIRAFPDDLDLEIEATGEYSPEMETVFASLTDRQREILATAIRLGYYSDPREVSQQEVAASLDLARGTVSEHLRRIESKVFSEAVLAGWDEGSA